MRLSERYLGGMRLATATPLCNLGAGAVYIWWYIHRSDTNSHYGGLLRRRIGFLLPHV